MSPLREPHRECPVLRPASASAALLPAVLWLTAFLLSGCTATTDAPSDTDTPQAQQPEVHRGRLDLTNRRWEETKPVELHGEWEFYHQTFLAPGESACGDPGDRAEPPVTLTVPGAWNGQPGPEGPLPGETWGTYRMVLTLDSGHPPLSLKLMEMCSSYRLYVNGRLTASNGRPAASREASIPRFRPEIQPLPPPPDRDGPYRAEIILHVANFHQRVGGAWGEILLGPTDTLREIRRNTLAAELFIVGALFLMAAYHGMLFLLRQQAWASLFFALICLLVGLRTLLTGERFLIQTFPQGSWAFFTYLEYFTFYLAIPLFILFFYRLYPRESSRRAVQFLLGICGFFNLLVILLPPRIFSHTLYAFQVVTLLGALYLMSVIIKALLRRREGSRLFTLALTVVLLGLGNDILNANGALRTGVMVPYALLLFIFCQAAVLAQRFTRAMERTERYAREIRELNTSLERKVEQRTRELKELAQRDSLTRLYNHGTILERLTDAISLAQRYRRPLSALMLDIDHFKRINDTWGHQKGDEILRKTCRTIEKALRKNDLAGRYGGEEFLVILPETSLEAAKKAAERIRRRVEETGPGLDPPLTFTISGGLAGIAGDTTMEELIDQADQYLYQAKEAGRNRIVSG